jgi:hypothetical protein
MRPDRLRHGIRRGGGRRGFHERALVPVPLGGVEAFGRGRRQQFLNGGEVRVALRGGPALT